MAESIIERATARRNAALREVAEWDAFIRRYQELAVDEQHGTAVPQRQGGPVERQLPPDSELGKTVALVDAILTERGQPMTLSELFAEVTRRGFHVSGDKPRDNLGARLYNSGKYKSFGKRVGWWFKDRPRPRLRLDDEPRSGGEPPDSSEPSRTAAATTNGIPPRDMPMNTGALTMS